MHRFFVDGGCIERSGLSLTDENAAHAHVLRLAVGEEVVVCDGDGMDYYCTVTFTSKSATALRVRDRATNTAEPPMAITLYQALPKTGKMDEIIDKCTQLGVSRIVPVITARCVAKASDRDTKKIYRWQKIALSAARQSQRGRVPQVYDVMTLSEVLETVGNYDAIFACYEAEDMLSLRAFLQGLPQNPASIAFFIGPEGGFAQEEIAKLKENGVATVSLGSRILRTELAGSVVLANILYEMEGAL